MRPNHLKGKLKAGQPALGCSVMFPSPQIVEMLGHAGFDWVLLDCEHGSLSLAHVEVMAMAADAVGITPIARPAAPPRPTSKVSWIVASWAFRLHISIRLRVLRGQFRPSSSGPVRGEALPPAPGRTHGGSAFRWRISRTAANEQSLVCVQLEPEAAIDNADEILKVEGIDVFFIGPSDLSHRWAIRAILAPR
jgi:2-keto-3-deoxy-L-rhamnonate aldolase RhmA